MTFEPNLALRLKTANVPRLLLPRERDVDYVCPAKQRSCLRAATGRLRPYVASQAARWSGESVLVGQALPAGRSPSALEGTEGEGGPWTSTEAPAEQEGGHSAIYPQGLGKLETWRRLG